MGLEIVELIMDVEEAYGITLPDDALDRVVTVGDFYDRILQLIREQQPHLVDNPAFMKGAMGLDHVLRKPQRIPLRRRRGVTRDPIDRGSGLRVSA
ncbi:MAG: hypothetical protein ACPGYV_03230 [Phycisphaeraceae bacterium]